MSSALSIELPVLEGRLISPIDISYMVVANNDRADIHVDPGAAAAAGLPGCVAPGSFVLGHIGVLLERLAGPASVRRLDVRFRAAVYAGDTLSTGGSIIGQNLEETMVNVWVRRADGTLIATGEGTVRTPPLSFPT